MLHCGDNIEFMKSLNDNSVDLIYLDPPYFTQRNFNEFNDRWKSINDYLTYMKVVFKSCDRLLKPTGSIYVQCDDNAVFNIKLLMDKSFNRIKYRNMISWQRSKSKNDAVRNWGRVLDYILYYASNNSTFNVQYTPLDEDYIKRAYIYNDNDGRGKYLSRAIHNAGETGGYFYTYKGYDHPRRGWLFPIKTMEKLDKDNKLIFPKSKEGRLREKLYLNERKGVAVKNLWDDFMTLQKGKEYTSYPTQKPLALLERIVETSSNKGDTVFDPFCGSGTSLVVAKTHRRKYIGCDINPNAIEISKIRLSETEKGLF